MYRKIFLASAILLSVLTACDKDTTGGEPELVAAEIVSGSESISVDVGNYTPIDLVWTPGSWNGEGNISYRAVIDTEDGDFSEPLMTYTPLKGTLSVFVPQADIEEIWNLTITEGSETATVKWAVETTAGETTIRSASQNIIMVKSEQEAGKFEVGMPVFMAGDGAKEGGQTMSCIAEHPFNINSGVFQDGQAAGMTDFDYEIFTEIEAGKPVFLAYGDKADEIDGYIVFDGTALNEPSIFELTGELPENGFIADVNSVYRIRLNAANNQILIQEVGDVAIRCFGRNPNDKETVQTNISMEYTGNGCWKAADFDIQWGNPSNFAKRYDAYKFAVKINGNDQLYGADDLTLADNPEQDSDKSYWALQPVKGGAKRAAGAFRYPGWLLSADKNPAWSADVVLHLNLDNGEYYYHEFINEKEK